MNEREEVVVLVKLGRELPVFGDEPVGLTRKQAIEEAEKLFKLAAKITQEQKG